MEGNVMVAKRPKTLRSACLRLGMGFLIALHVFWVLCGFVVDGIWKRQQLGAARVSETSGSPAAAAQGLMRRG